jgi:hypothetical protein
MSTAEQSWRPAWEPLTPRGVGAFAGATLGRLLLAQLLVALLVAASVIGFLERGWFPVVRAAIHQLPALGEISEQLDWHGETPVQLAENRFLGFAVDLYHSGRLGRESHLQVEFGQDDLRIYSLLGYQVIDYPPGWKMAFNRTDLEPRWGAWEPFIAVGVGLLTVLGLMASWTALATIYFVPVRVISFLENHDLNFAQSWRLAGATMMPGALFLVAGIAGYSLGWIDLIQLTAMWGLHFLIGWIYLVIGPLFCPRSAGVKSVGANPFAEPKSGKE